ncbi:MAG: MFS transporter [Chitinophagaceae bacterium]|nr:MFS transporter [Chitinophagaceae bacterium]
MFNKNRSAALGFIFVTVLIDVIGFGIIIPVIPSLIQKLTGGDMSVASRYGGFLMFSYAIMQFLFAPVLGNLSDRYGRRTIILISLFGFGIDYLLLAWAPNIIWLFIARIISGITGASITTASAYIADITAPEKRAQNFGLLGAAFGMETCESRWFFVAPEKISHTYRLHRFTHIHLYRCTRSSKYLELLYY